MPVLKLKLAPPQAPEVHARLASALTAITASLLGKRPEVTAVVIDAVPADRWYIQSQSHAVAGPTALLEISITAGTNTPAEKETFIRAAFDELQRQLGQGRPLAEASYVVVRELPASDWGYQGRTQLARRLATSAPMDVGQPK